MAEIMADFDADDDREGITLSGMINNFMTDGTAQSGWMVELMADSDTETDAMDSYANLGTTALESGLSTEWSTGGIVKGKGMWSPTFYGETDAGMPMAVVGTFDAAIGGGDVARLQGAFGANKVDD